MKAINVMPETWIPPFSIFGWGASYAVTNGDEGHTAIIDELTKQKHNHNYRT